MKFINQHTKYTGPNGNLSSTAMAVKLANPTNIASKNNIGVTIN